ncbi:MAG: methyltransferase, TIGR04325 family [Vicinamibacterales bacterium]
MKELARALTPPFMWRAFSRLRERVVAPPAAMFRGVHDTFSAVADARPWDQARYLDASRRLLRECQSGQLPPQSETAHALITFILNTMPAGAVPRVLDWAGGTGIRYWTTRRALHRPVQWLVVDRPVLASISREIMGESAELSFREALPARGAATFDIVIAYASLQYVESQRELLEALASYRPRYILLVRLMTRLGRGYVTCQNVHGFDTPCKVSSLEEIETTLKGCGYHQTLLMDDGLDLTLYFDDNVPDELRVGRERLLVFERDGDAH